MTKNDKVKLIRRQEVQIPNKQKQNTVNYNHTADFLRKYEGFKDSVYLDSKGIPTIGYGFTDSSYVNKKKMSRQEADVVLQKELAKRDKFLSTLNDWNKLGEGAKTALRSYYYNYPAGFNPTTKFYKAWNSGNYAEAIRQVDAGWNDAKNPGLRRRRQAEQLLLKSDPYLFKNMNSYSRPISFLESTLTQTPYPYRGINDTDYDRKMKRVARDNYKQWGFRNSKEAYIHATTDPAYDYRGYYSKYPNGNGNAKDHWSDEFKTVQHPTFSIESRYSGLPSTFNPLGLMGGFWIGEDTFIPGSANLMQPTLFK